MLLVKSAGPKSADRRLTQVVFRGRAKVLFRKMNLAQQIGQYFSDYILSWNITLKRFFTSRELHSTAVSPYLKSHFFESHQHVLLVVQTPIIGYNDELVKHLILHLLESGVGSVVLAAGDVQGCIEVWSEIIEEVTRDPRVFIQPIKLHEKENVNRFIKNIKAIRKNKISYLICLESPYLPIDGKWQITVPSKDLICLLQKESLFSTDFKLIFVTSDLWLLLRKNLLIPMMYSYSLPFVQTDQRPFISYYTGPICVVKVKNIPRFTDHSPYSLGLLISWIAFLTRILFSPNPIVSSAKVIETLKTQGLLNGQNLLSIQM